MFLKPTKIAALTATLIAFGSLAGGVNAAVTYYIQDAGSKVSITTLGGSLDLTGDSIDDGGFWDSAPKAVLDDQRTGVTNNENSEVATGTITFSAAWTNGSIGPSGPGAGSWIGSSSFMMIFTGRRTLSNLFLTDGTTAGVISVGAGTFTTNLDYSVAGIGLTTGESVTWRSKVTNDTVTYIVGSAVPEASSILLLGLGALGCAARRNRTR